MAHHDNRIEGLGTSVLGCGNWYYVLVYRNTKLAVIEAKAWGKPLTEGVAQAKNDAGKLAIRFTYATNGQGVYAIDMQTGTEGETAAFPGPDALWAATYATENLWRDRFAAVPYEDKGGKEPIRYYQDIAVSRVLQAISEGRQRILLTLATGTGKTSIAFHIAWKLFQARWSLGGETTRRPRILFLADRNNLADQAKRQFSAFGAFSEDAMARIEPEEIKKKGVVPKNANIFFTIFQTFMSGPPKDGQPSPYFGDYPADFFDCIIIDECHRGGARDESSWRDILNRFAPAVQIGLTATPKRKDNIDTYAYFGEPLFSYALKDGINDGFLTPFRVKQIATTMDDYVYTPDDTLIEGEAESGKLYIEKDFNKIIEIKEREEHRVKLFMSQIDQTHKTLVFCATQLHALAVRDLINQINTSKNPNYCQRVTANDGALGEQHLRDFQDNEKTIPTILTTSQKLSTGVDARNIRNIVLMRPVNSMIEFKQIIGRGTRLYDGKEYFTVYDFVKAYQHFSDPEWDGEPLEPEPATPKTPTPDPAEPADPAPPPDPGPKRGKLVVKLADGKARNIQHMMCTSFWHPDGTPMSAAQFMELLFGKLPDFFADEEDLRKIWGDPDTRKTLLEKLTDAGIGRAQLAEMQTIIDAPNSDLFDVLAHVAFAAAPLTRAERADAARPAIGLGFDAKKTGFLDFVLSHYISEGVEELDGDKLNPLLKLRYHDSIQDALDDLGDAASVRSAFLGFQKHLYPPL